MRQEMVLTLLVRYAILYVIVSPFQMWVFFHKA
jgi:hypothetical protein